MTKWRLTRWAAAAVGAFVLSMSCAGAAMADSAQTETSQQTQAAAITATATIQSATIGSDKSTVTVTAKTGGDLAGTDQKFYLFELKPYQDTLDGRTDYIASATGTDLTWNFPLNQGSEADRLYSSFVVAVYDVTKGAYTSISEPHYITNPEAVAKNTAAFKDPLTKKGLVIEINMLSDAFDLGVKHVGTNIAFHQILGSGIDYTYDGKTYHFSKAVMEEYDRTISALSGKGMTVNAVILNGWNDATPDLIYPGTKKSSNAFYYLFNVATKEGFEQTRAIIAFLAERYNGSDPNHGKISNWVIGNEINNQQWNYTGAWDLTSYVKAYQKAFRVFYTAIKSASANDRVYFSVDYNWNNEIDHKLKYGGKEVLDSFNSIANNWGQIDWGLAYHPYPCPMTDPNFWDDDQTGLVKDDINSPVINFKNLTVLTDYMASSAFRAPSGNVRHIILTEEGFTAMNQKGEDVSKLQAAAYAYSYYMVDSNPYIDAYILSRQIDAPSEVNQKLAFGLWTCDMSKPNQIIAQKRRKIWQVFRDIDKKNATLEATEFAKEIIGINKWSDVIENFKWRAQE